VSGFMREELESLLLQGFSSAKIEALEEQYPTSPWRKFRHWREHIQRNADYVIKLDLHQVMPSQQVLDIGTAYGYFPLLLERMGHRALGLDTFSPELDLVWSILGSPSVGSPVYEFTPLSFPLPFPDFQPNIITTMGVNFATGDVFWDWDRYEYFYLDCLSRLQPSGYVYAYVNWGSGTDFILDPPTLNKKFGHIANVSVKDNQIWLRRIN
jgi:SAM-dependent methyltransferase